MAIEAIAAVALAGLVLWIVLEPLYGHGPAEPDWVEPLDPEETRKGIALIALKEIEFDRATGKISDTDFEFLKARYAAEALEAIRAEELAAPQADPVEAMIAARVAALDGDGGVAVATATLVCARCGPRPEADARFCSNCGASLAAAGGGSCGTCQAPLAPGARFCGECGARAAA